MSRNRGGGGRNFGLDTMSNSSYFWKMIKIWERDPPTPNGETKSTPALLENRSNFSIGTPDPIQTIIIFTTYMNKNGIYQLLSWVLSLKSRNFKHFYDRF